jgi:hypothetical protein
LKPRRLAATEVFLVCRDGGTMLMQERAPGVFYLINDTGFMIESDHVLITSPTLMVMNLIDHVTLIHGDELALTIMLNTF